MTKNLPKLLAAKIQPPPEIMLGRQLDFQLSIDDISDLMRLMRCYV
ncbi:MAG: hypothetical protein IKP73_15815 [Bacteroidales bacterium]|nr:hypothetical protein [Bacteroidales bacterium]